MREPQLVGVLGILILGRAAGMNVRIDEARHQVHPGAVDFMVCLRTAILAERNARRAGAADSSDAIARDDDVHWAGWWCAAAIDDHDAADDERLERSLAFVGAAVRCAGQAFTRLRLGGRPVRGCAGAGVAEDGVVGAACCAAM